MTNVDVSKIKPGDVVGVRVLEVSRATGSYRIESSPDYLGAWVSTPAIVSHTPAPRPALKVGDRVRRPDQRELQIAFFEADRYAHFAVVTEDYRRCLPEPLSEVETWERV